MDIEECVHTYAPTGQFKCCCDACGNDTKWFMRPDEQACKVRAGNGFKVFMYLHKNMPPPVPSTADSPLRFHLSGWLQRYVVPKVYAPADYEEGVLYRQCVLKGLVVVVEVKDDRQQRSIQHMRKVYQFIRYEGESKHKETTVQACDVLVSVVFTVQLRSVYEGERLDGGQPREGGCSRCVGPREGQESCSVQYGG